MNFSSDSNRRNRMKRIIEEHNVEASDSDVAEELGVGRSTKKRACRERGSTHHVIVEKVMIKVQYEEDIIMFEFCLSLGMSKLFEKVATKLNLKVGAFKLKYVDVCNEEIMMTSNDDEDLELCCRTQMTNYKTCLRLLVR